MKFRFTISNFFREQRFCFYISAITGGVYIRWGKSGCPSTASKVYDGSAAAAWKNAQGGGSNYLCLTKSPVYNEPQEGLQERSSKLYSVEYRTGFPPLQHLNNHDVPCVVCQAKSTRVNVLMVPGRNQCPAGWTFEYGGYLMSERSSHYRTEFVCVDQKAKGLNSLSSARVDGKSATMQTVEGVCSNTEGGLPCPFYVNGNELTCAVCSK